jgi:predicted peptidase
MRRPLGVLVTGLLTLLGGCATSRDALREGQHPARFERTTTVTSRGQYLLSLPTGYDASGRTRYPLVIFLHGSGESGTDLSSVAIHGPPHQAATGRALPFILASPQSPYTCTYGGYDPVMLDAFLDELLATLPVDADRVYLTGLSMGGIWTYGWASRRPERFAALAPISAAWGAADACRLKDLPIRAFHGAKDDVIPAAHAKTLVDAIRACGGDASLTIYPDAGHNAWTRTYDDPDFYPWLLAQRRRSPAQ